jgi:hypothetical protein
MSVGFIPTLSAPNTRNGAALFFLSNALSSVLLVFELYHRRALLGPFNRFHKGIFE